MGVPAPSSPSGCQPSASAVPASQSGIPNAGALLALAESVEQATGPDRRLDVLIGCAVRHVPDQPGCEWAKADHWRFVPVPRISERIGCADKAGNVAAHWEAPRYTASLGTALTLVPEGWHLAEFGESLDDNPNRNKRTYTGRWGAMLHSVIPGLLQNLKYGDAATPALALTAAALRAHASGIEAPSGDETRSGSAEGESPTAESGDAQPPSPAGHP